MNAPNKFRYVKEKRTLVPNIENLSWKCHTPNLLAEALKNPGAEMLRMPIRILGELLHGVAERAAEINDPALNILMLRPTLYEIADPEKHSSEEIEAAFAGQRHAMVAEEGGEP